MNSLASFIAHPKERGYKFLKDEKQHRQIMNTAIQDARSKNKLKSLANKDNIFIEEEIEWIILGNNLKTVEDYKKAKRAGRGRRLGSSQREELWVVYESYRSQLRSQRYTTHDIVVCEAYDKVRTLPHDKKYDFVFIDEAQDFKPVGLRLCIALCKDPKNVYLTADINQGIYGHDISWTSIDGTLKSAKKEELEQNYRFTKEISEAIRLISLKIQVKDKDTLNSNCVYRGNPPTIKYYKDSEDELQSITEFIIRNAHDLNVGLGCAAILCRSNRDAEELTKKLPPKLKAKYMHSNEVDIEYNGVKVITMHAAKGLQFPIVVVARINKGVFPIPPHGGQAEEEHFDMEWKLFFVACSRAMRSLLVTTNKQKPSLFLEGLTDDYWEIIGK
jgi:superfamily I DNA/RNA helicase